MLELREVSKRFGDFQALQSTSLKFPAGSSTALLGPSGCGKSTLLRVIMGLAPTDTGEVLFDGQTLAPDNVLTARRRMGYMIQDGGLFPHLSVRDNVQLLARHLGWDRDRCAARMNELVSLKSMTSILSDRQFDLQMEKLKSKDFRFLPCIALSIFLKTYIRTF